MTLTSQILVLGSDAPLSIRTRNGLVALLETRLVTSGADEPTLITARTDLEAELRQILPTDGDPGSRTTLVYLAEERGADAFGPDPLDAEAVFELFATLEMDHLVLVSSGEIHEPSAHHPNRIREDQRARRRTGNTQPDRWLELEGLAREIVGDDRLTVLRAAAVITPGGRNFWSRLFQRRFALTLPGFDPTLQCLAADDLVRAIARVIESLAENEAPSEPRIYNVVPWQGIPLRKALWRARTLRLPVPRFLQAPIRKLLAPFGLAVPPEQLDYLRYPWTLSGEKIRQDLGFEAEYSSARAIDATRTIAASPAPDYDPYGLDIGYIRRLSNVFFRFLHDFWWRIEVRGLDNVPTDGPAVLTGVHRGFQPWDGVMAMYLVARERGRHIRFLTHPSLLKFPFLAPYMIKMGGVPANREAGDWTLGQGEILAIFPEGIRGAFQVYGPEIYRIGKMGRDEYVRFALRHRAPIVPFVTIGSAEIFPIWAKLRWPWWERLSEWPCFPLTPTLGTVPLPSKWHTIYLEPIPTDGHPPDAEHDRELVGRLSAEVKERMQDALDELLARRRHVFRGSIFREEGATLREADPVP